MDEMKTDGNKMVRIITANVSNFEVMEISVFV